MRINDMNLLAPVARVAFLGLEASLRRHTPFRAFETYRSPADQAAAVAKGVSKAVPFLSAHQLGLAVDFVPYGPSGWYWPDAEDPIWVLLRREATALGLVNNLNWDRPHVEHRAYASILPLLRRAKG